VLGCAPIYGGRNTSSVQSTFHIDRARKLRQGEDGLRASAFANGVGHLRAPWFPRPGSKHKETTLSRYARLLSFYHSSVTLARIA